MDIDQSMYGECKNLERLGEKLFDYFLHNEDWWKKDLARGHFF
jgi:hypothetical protein